MITALPNRSDTDGLPNGWAVQRLGEVCRIRTGKKDVNEGNPIGEFPFFTCSKETHYSDSYSFDTEAILVAGNGAVGETKYYCGKFEAYQRTYVLDSFAAFAPYIYLFLKSTLIAELAKHVSGSTMPYIRKGDLENIKIPVPPSAEQRRIAAVLSLVQRALEQQERLLTLITELKKSLLHQLFMHGLHHESQKQSELGPIPQSWKIGTLNDVKLDQKGAVVSGPFGSNIGKRFFVEAGVPLICGCNLTKADELFVEEGFVFITEEKAQELKSCEALPGDLIFTAAGTVGQVGLIPPNCLFPKYIISNKQLRARIDPAKTDSLYLFHWFASDAIQALIAQRRSGSSIPVINLSILRGLPIPLPQTIEEQKEIASAIVSIDAKRALHRRKHDAFSALFRTLMHELMTAKIRVHDLDLPELESMAAAA